jgi:hypothetical protein
MSGAGATQAVYTSTDILTVYQLGNVNFSQTTITANAPVSADASGQTIAIVEAFDDPAIVTDLYTFDAKFGLKDPPSLTKMNQWGSTQLPAASAAWARETALDVEWAHAIAPGANLIIVEASSDHLSDLLAAVDTARHLPSVSVVTMSWGANEFSGETSFDSLFTTPAGHIGVTFVAAAGDAAAATGVQYPSASPNVVSVGGTTLFYSATSSTAVETAWSGSISGTSQFEPLPSYQSYLGATGRVTPDVVYNADPQTGYAVYDSVAYRGLSGWQVLGGTSAAAPQWAAIVALANQGRALNGQNTLDGSAGTLPALYQFYNTPAATGPQSTTAPAAGVRHSLLGPGGTPLAQAVIAALIRRQSALPAASASALVADIDWSRGKNITVTFFALPMENLTRAMPIAGSTGAHSINMTLAAQSLMTAAAAANAMTIVAGSGARAYASVGSLSSALIATTAEGLRFRSAARNTAVASANMATWAIPAGGAPPAVIVRAAVNDLRALPPLPTSLFHVSHINVTAFLSDSVSQFIEECASLETRTLAVADPNAQNGHLRAWSITAAVLAIDAVILSYALPRRSRRSALPAAPAPISKPQTRHLVLQVGAG